MILVRRFKLSRRLHPVRPLPRLLYHSNAAIAESSDFLQSPYLDATLDESRSVDLPTFDPLINTSKSGTQNTPSALKQAPIPSSLSLEQNIVLEACLATLNLDRAKKVWGTICALQSNAVTTPAKTQLGHLDNSNDALGRQINGNQPIFIKDIVAPHIHTAFLRTHFRLALSQPALSKQYVRGAWNWLDMLLRDENNVGKMELASWAVMLKGLAATRTDNSAASRPMTSVLALMRTHGVSLKEVLQEPIFSHPGIPGLTAISPLDVIGIFREAALERNEVDFLYPLDSVRAALEEEAMAQQPDVTKVDSPIETEEKILAEAIKLSPTLKGDSSVPFRLNVLRSNLDIITEHKLHLKDLYVRQELLEESAYDAARWQHMQEEKDLDSAGVSGTTKLKMTSVQDYMSTWLPILTAEIENKIEELKEQSDDEPAFNPESTIDTHFLPSYRNVATFDARGKEFLPFLDLVDPAILAQIAILETLRLTCVPSRATGIVNGTKIAQAVMQVGRAVEEEFGAATWRELNPVHYAEAMRENQPRIAVRKFLKNRSRQSQSPAANITSEQDIDEEEDKIRVPGVEIAPWSQLLRLKVGALLVDCLLKTTTVSRSTFNEETGQEYTETQPAFFQAFQYSRGVKTGILKLNSVLSRLFENDPLNALLHPRLLPMLVMPRPWVRYDSGGYRVHRTTVVRTKESAEQSRAIKQADANGELTQIYGALDYLGSTPWQVNHKVFDVIAAVWNSDEAIADIPIKDPLLNIPDPEPPSPEEMKDQRTKEQYRLRLETARRNRQSAHSERCSMNYQLEIARSYLGETMYFPHNVDFRGRAYPIPPNFSHIGNDLCRGLLLFGKGKELGEAGLRWLKIHLANVYGFDKASLEDRKLFAERHMDDVFDSIDRPLEGNRWWLQAEDPWQCLATCFELGAAMRSADPTKFVSQLPVHVDGTCNGLQHYAALGGDVEGAAQVNLSAGESPSDVYSAVARLVNIKVDNDAAKGMAVAKTLQGHVSRKVVKQTVMTTVYGVTVVGAKEQIEKQLKANPVLAKEDHFMMARYLVHLVLGSIGTLFKGASAIQVWLALAASLVTSSVKPMVPDMEVQSITQLIQKPKETLMAWTTPLGLPIIQPYRKEKRCQVKSALEQSVYISDPQVIADVDRRSQSSAFPPNYVHSLDATHMMLTCLKAQREGLTYAAVHDSYWTHAADIECLSSLLREAFVELHSQDLLGKLRQEVLDTYGDNLLVQDPNARTAHQKAAFTSADNNVTAHDLTSGDSTISGLPFTPLAYAQAENGEQADTVSKSSKRASKKQGLGAEPKKIYRLRDVLPPLPEKGKFDLELVRKSTYFFS